MMRLLRKTSLLVALSQLASAATAYAAGAHPNSDHCQKQLDRLPTDQRPDGGQWVVTSGGAFLAKKGFLHQELVHAELTTAVT